MAIDEERKGGEKLEQGIFPCNEVTRGGEGEGEEEEKPSSPMKGEKGKGGGMKGR